MNPARKFLYGLFIFFCLAGLAFHYHKTRPQPKTLNPPTLGEAQGLTQGTALGLLLEEGRLVKFDQWTEEELALLPGFGEKKARQAKSRGHLTDKEQETLKGYLIP